MTSIVLQLQELASTNTATVAELVRKARMVAIKLDLTEFNSWLTHELHGYPSGDSVPNYRILQGDLRARNPYNGALMPVRFEARVTDMLSECRERQSIGTLEELANCGSNNLQVGFGSKELELVLSLVDPQYRDWLVPYRQISRSQLRAIIDRVRNLILDWALDLEKNRILGEGMTFSDEEKKRASSTAITVHGNFQGIIGDVRESKLSQDFVMTIEAGNLESLSKNLGRLGVPAAEITQLQSAIEADPMPTQRGAFGPNVAQWFGNLIGRVSGGAYQLAIGAGGDLLANSIWAYYGF